MAFLAAVPIAMLVGAGLGATASIYKGISADRAARADAGAMDRQASLEQAGAQRAAGEERRRAGFAQSRALALAAASGGGVSDPTVTNILSGIGVEGEFRALTRLFNGDEAALALRRQALNRRKEGRAALRSGVLEAATGAATFGTSMFQKYGGGGPKGQAVDMSPVYNSTYPI